MATTILEQIAVKIAAKLATVTAANGYEITVGSVVRPTMRAGYIAADKLVILIQGDCESDEESQTYDLLAWRQDFFATILLRQSETATGAFDTEMNQAIGALQKALMTDPTWDGLAEDTDLLPYMPFDPIGHEGFDGAAVGAAVLYRVKRDDPYAQQ